MFKSNDIAAAYEDAKRGFESTLPEAGEFRDIMMRKVLTAMDIHKRFNKRQFSLFHKYIHILGEEFRYERAYFFEQGYEAGKRAAEEGK